jgi:hypothetical protein
VQFWRHPASSVPPGAAVAAAKLTPDQPQQSIDGALPAGGTVAGNRQYVPRLDERDQIVDRLIWTRSDAAHISSHAHRPHYPQAHWGHEITWMVGMRPSAKHTPSRGCKVDADAIFAV